MDNNNPQPTVVTYHYRLWGGPNDGEEHTLITRGQPPILTPDGVYLYNAAKWRYEWMHTR